MNRIIDAAAAFESYLGTALWATSVPTEDGNWDLNLDDIADTDDFSDETIAELKSEFNDFLTQVYELLKELGDDDYISDEILGHDFWLTRCGHGAGFWDGDWGSLGGRLTEISKVYGNIDLYPGDDGKIYSN